MSLITVQKPKGSSDWVVGFVRDGESEPYIIDLQYTLDQAWSLAVYLSERDGIPVHEITPEGELVRHHSPKCGG